MANTGPINNWYKNNSEFGKSKIAGYPNSTIAPIPEVDLNFINEPILNRVNNKYFKKNNLVFNTSDYSQNPNFVGPSLYNQPINGQDFATYINNPNNGYKIANEEEEYDAGEDWRNAELERRKKIQESFTPIENPNYTQQLTDTLKGLQKEQELKAPSVQTTTPTTTWVKLNANKGVQKAGKATGYAAAAAGIAADIGDNVLNKNYKGNQGAYVSGAFGKNTLLTNVNNVNKSLNATDFGNLQGQYKNQNSILDEYKTQELSNKQRLGLVGVGAGKGAATGASIGSLAGPMGTIIGAAAGTAIGATTGALKGHFANKKIKETNEAAAFAQQGLNNSYLATAQNIRNIYANNKKSDMFNNQAYYGANGGYLYANGGLMNPYGINEFNTGGTHEQNKYGGVPVSIAEDGKPNLVEEGEVLFDDYVYSNRIKINDTIRRRLKLKDSTKTFADAAKEIKERGDDRPNDPVTEKTIKAQMQFLKSEQDKKKEQQEEREQQKMIAQMNEQQLQAMQEQQMNEEADAYEQQMAEEQMAQQAPQEQQMVNPQMQEQMIAQQQQPQQQMFANGGHLYPDGGEIKKGIFKELGFNTKGDFKRWQRKHNLEYVDDADFADIIKDPNFINAVMETNPTLAHSLINGYDYGNFTTKIQGGSTLSTNTPGSWTNRTGSDWAGSTDEMYLEAKRNHPDIDTYSEAELQKAFMETEAYKRATENLKNDEEARRKYFAAVLNSNAPKEAKDYAKQFINEDGTWKKNKDRSYDATFKNVRERQPGTYWKTPVDITRNANKKNFVYRNGEFEEIEGDVPQDWKQTSNRKWTTKDGNNITDFDYTYYAEPNGLRGGEETNPNYTWRYKQTPVPGLIDTYLAARAFAPADYSRANSIINTPIRDIQYTPNGGKIAPYIIGPRLQYQMNADLGAATNRGLVNNAGGNSAAAQAALLANNRQISQSAANLGYQADAQNAAQIQAAQQFNNAVDAQNAQGFISAAEANQRADVQRGEFNYYGQNMKENIDAQRGQAISNSLQSLSDDYMNYYKDRYNQGMMAGLVDSGYFGEPTPFLRQQTGWNPNGTFTRNNYLIDDNGNKHYIVNNADGTVSFANPNDDLISKNQGKKLVFNNGEYKFVG
jgi:hypothetical protein